MTQIIKKGVHPVGLYHVWQSHQFRFCTNKISSVSFLHKQNLISFVSAQTKSH